MNVATRRWLEQESRVWVDRGVISQEQREEIVGLYPTSHVQPANILVILASLLVGFGFLSFVAANWQEISDVVKLSVIFGSMTGVYLLGDYLDRRGMHRWGQSMAFLGVLLFGVGLMLIGQIYHIVTFNATALYFWAVAAILTAYVYYNQVFVILGLVLLTMAQGYTISEFSGYSYTYFLLFAVFFLPYLIRYSAIPILITALLSFSLSVLMFIMHYDYSILWILVYGSALLLAADLLRGKEIAPYLQGMGYFTGIIVTVIFTFDAQPSFLLEEAQTDVMVGVMIALSLILAGHLFLTARGNHNWVTLFGWVIFLPAYLHPFPDLELVYLLALFLFSIYMILFGARQQEVIRINAGIVVFIASCLIGYGQLAWSFMPKSMFFVVGGLLLFVLSFILQKQKQQWLLKGEER